MTLSYRSSEVIKAAHNDPLGRLTVVIDKLGALPPLIETSGPTPARFEGQDWIDALCGLRESHRRILSFRLAGIAQL